MKFLVNNVFPNVCEISGKITFQISILNVDNSMPYQTYIFNNNAKLLLLKNFVFEINYPSNKKITNILVKQMESLLFNYNTPSSLTCPICNNQIYTLHDESYCLSLFCIGDDLEKTIYNQIKTISSTIDYDFFKTFIFNIVIGYRIDMIDLIFLFQTFLNQQQPFSLFSKKIYNQYNQLMIDFNNIKPSTFFKLCKCPIEYYDYLSNIDNHILDINHLYNILNIESDTYKSNIFPNFGIVEDKVVENYIRLAFKVNFEFITKYMNFKSQGPTI